MKNKIVFIVEKTSDGFSAYAKDFDKIPAGTTGDTMKELRQNIEDAYNSVADLRGWPEVSIDDITIQYDLGQFFEYYKEISAKGVAQRVGISPAVLSQYVNKKRIPSDKQVKKILKGIQELGRELATLELV
jgi:transcriptional regulator with XRE-family HTH domain